jgi:hypothetical protein
LWATFKEKTYETYFLAEMRDRTRVFFSPDQTDEAFLGFDAAFHVPFPEMYPLFPFVRARRWSRFLGISASEIESFGQEINERLPTFRLNLFVQYKRPEFLVRTNAAEWKSWNRPYFRFGVDQSQQALLEKIVLKGAGRAAVVYASPAFHLSRTLFEYANAGTIISNSNIASAGLLRGHHRFSFIQAGHFGIGHSEPEEITSPSIDAILEGNALLESLPFTRQMKATVELIKLALEDDPGGRDLWSLAQRTILGGRIDDAYPRAAGTWLDAMLSIVAFSQAFGVRVCAVG